MALTAPAITSPREGESFSTNIENQVLEGVFNPNENITKVLVNEAQIQDGINGTVNFNTGTFIYPVLLSPGSNSYVVKVVNSIGLASDSVSITITLASASEMVLSVSPVTGIDKRVKRDSVEIIWQENAEPTVEGYNLYYSLLPGGGLNGYKLVNDSLITEPAFFKDVEEEVSRTENLSDTRTATQLFPITSVNSVLSSDLSPDLDVATDEVISATIYWNLTGTTNLTNCVAIRLRSPLGNYFTLKAFGQIDPQAADVTNIYLTEGVGKYVIYLDELLGCGAVGTFATLTGAQMFVKKDSFDRTLTILNKTNRIRFFSQLQNSIDGAPLQEGTPIYYVITALGFDPTLQQEVESVYSAEQVAVPLTLNTNIENLPVRAYAQIAQSYRNRIRALEKGPDQPDVKPGTVWSDIAIDPPAKESELEYRVIDFGSRAQSFLTLLQLDDQNNDGVPDLVTESTYKQSFKEALGGNALITDAQVQAQIDTAFDKLAANVYVFRKGAVAAIGEVVFFLNSFPVKDLSVPAGTIFTSIADPESGIQSQEYELLSDVNLFTNSAQSQFVAARNRYEIIGQIRCTLPGSGGNIPAGLISNASVFGFDGVENLEATSFGEDEETNASLAERAMLAFISVDVGTSGGYKALALRQFGILKAKVVGAGDEFMMRDWFCPTLEHIGGKVDVYVEGDQLQQVQENFAFAFIEVKNERVTPSITSAMVVRVGSEDPSPDVPVFKVTEVRNITRGGVEYDLSNLVIREGVFIDIDETCPVNMAIGMGPFDIIEITYFYRGSSPYIFAQQPVQEITRLVGDFSGVLEEGVHYNLFKLEDPLLLGSSTKASDYMLIKYSGGLPLGEFKQVTGELHVLVAEDAVNLLSLGIVQSSIVVTSLDDSITYVFGADYILFPGDSKTRTQIARTSVSSIKSGQQVKIAYEAAELFTVSYRVNKLLKNVQNQIDGNEAAEIDGKRHVTADVILKDALKTNVDLEFTIVLKYGINVQDVNNKLRTKISRFMNQLTLGQSVFPSDIVSLIDETSGVDHVILPLAKMVKADGSISVFEEVRGNDIQFLPYSGSNGAFISAKFGTIGCTETNDERHFLSGETGSALTSPKAVGASIRVQNVDKLTTYTMGVDYDVYLNGETTLIKRKLTSIADGQQVSVSYLYGPDLIQVINEIITLTENVKVSLANKQVEIGTVVVMNLTHATTFQLGIDYTLEAEGEFTLLGRKPASIQDGTQVLVSYVAARFGEEGTKIIGEEQVLISNNLVSLNNIGVVESTIAILDLSRTTTYILGWDYNVILDGDFVKIVRTPVSTIQSGQRVLVDYSVFDVIPVQVLQHKSIASGALPTVFKGFFVDSVKAKLLEDPGLVGRMPSQAYINADGSVVLSKSSGNFNHKYNFTYQIFGEDGQQEIKASPLEVLRLGQLTIFFA